IALECMVGQMEVERGFKSGARMVQPHGRSPRHTAGDREGKLEIMCCKGTGPDRVEGQFRRRLGSHLVGFDFGKPDNLWESVRIDAVDTQLAGGCRPRA